MEYPLTFEKHRKGLRVIAVFEAVKGLLVLLVGGGLLDLARYDIQKVGLSVIDHFKFEQENSTVLVHLLKGLTQGGILLASAGAVVYAVIRFAEAYGLWHGKGWAQWLGILSCGSYLPVEFYGIYHKLTGLKVGVTSVNILLLGYLVFVRINDMKSESNKSSNFEDFQS